VVDGDRRSSVLACNELAASFGIRVGHSLNATIALCADTQFLPRNDSREVELLQEVAARCEQYTSFVSLQPPNEVLLEVRGSFRLFGGIAAFLERVRGDFKACGFMPQLTLSSTSQSALWLARGAATPRVVRPRELIACIARLPVSLLHWPTDLELRLTRFGVLCIGDLLRLPRGSLARRIGHDRLAELDRAVGRHPETRKAHSPAEQYQDRILLDFDIETTSLLSIVIEKRLQRLARYLTARNLAIDQLHIDLLHRERRVTPVKIGLASPTADVAHVTRLMHEHLSHVELSAPVVEVQISIERLRPAPALSRELFRSIPSSEAAAASTEPQARLLEQLRSRLGSQAIVCLRAFADHRPECAHLTPPAEIQSAHPSSCVIPDTLAPRPLWLLPESRPICTTPGEAAKLKRLRGPERIEGGWWDGHCVVRDYYHVRSPQGALAWVYQDRAHAGQWCLHGLFA
jgi:protein ImuB